MGQREWGGLPTQKQDDSSICTRLSCSRSAASGSLQPLDCSPWDFPGMVSAVPGIFPSSILQWAAVSCSRGIFPTQRSNLHFLCLRNGRQILYLLSHWGNPAFGNGRKIL